MCQNHITHLPTHVITEASIQRRPMRSVGCYEVTEPLSLVRRGGLRDGLLRAFDALPVVVATIAKRCVPTLGTFYLRFVRKASMTVAARREDALIDFIGDKLLLGVR